MAPQQGAASIAQPLPRARGSGTSRGKLQGNLAGGTTVLIGALHGSLYALPADHLMLDLSSRVSAGNLAQLVFSYRAQLNTLSVLNTVMLHTLSWLLTLHPRPTL